MKQTVTLAFLTLLFAFSHAQPVVNLGADTSVCSKILLDAGSFANATYLWSTGAITQKLLVTTTGTYSVTVTTPSGTDSDTIYVATFGLPDPVISLGPDSVQCGGEILLNGPAGYAGYLWSSGVVNPYFQASVSGMYWLAVTDTNGCVGRDSILLTIHPQPFPGLGVDRAGCDSLILNASGGTSCLWNNGSTAPIRAITQSGTYSATVTDAGTGCSFADTVSVTIVVSNFLSLNPNRTGCDSVTIDVQVKGFIYQWSNGDTTEVASIHQPGQYSVIYMDSLGVCVDTQYFNVTIIPGPGIDLGPSDTLACSQPFVLDPGGSTATYSWSNGSTAKTQTITSDGAFTVTATATNGCVAKDSINVIFAPILTINLPDTVAECDSVTLFGFTNIAPGGWMWSTGEQSLSIVTHTSGYYTLTVKHPDNCPDVKDTVYAQIKPQPVPLFTVLVSGSTATFTNTSTDATSFLWNFGDNQSSTLKDPVHTYLQSGTYWVNLAATNECATVLTPQFIPVVVVGMDQDWSGSMRLIPVAPNRYDLQFVNPQATDLKVNIIDTDGRLMGVAYPASAGNGIFSAAIDASTWAQGLYFVQVVSSAGQRVERIVVE